ncbi:MAG: imidazole glycerol phosphate synthase subunit HisF [Cyclobacteriaceae bacterium]|nr:MAG: imidazole glycerol phosphate synthase subunit HisF [Cyclobacteriaceae bacterium]
MLTKRIIPCLDVKNGRTVKGINFINLRDAGDPVEMAATYAEQGADELVFLDISASQEDRKTMAQWVREVAHVVNIPFTVGGGIKSANDVAPLLEAGADKVTINTAAVLNPGLIEELAKAFGSQCVVVAIDARKINNTWVVHTHGGSRPAGKKLYSWARQVAELGAGEILFTSMDHDGTQQGFAVDALLKLNTLLHIPVIASGGAGVPGHFLDAFVLGRADAALAASTFHFGKIKIPELKKFLSQHNIPVRL